MSVAAATVQLSSISSRWLGPLESQGDREAWRLRLFFVSIMGETPEIGIGCFQLTATDGGPPAAVLSVTRAGPGSLDLVVIRLSETGANSQGRWFQLSIVGVPGVVATGAAARFALDRGEPPQPADPTQLAKVAPSAISYLAKDYPAFVTALQASLRLLDPQWTDVSPADVGVTITEVLAYAADNLSYYQDAVATEAYLGTARRRLSVRRHARLLGYVLREGCNARAWVQVQVQAAIDLPRGAQFIVGEGLPAATWSGAADYQNAVQAGALIFESLAPATLNPSLNSLRIYSWDQDVFQLSKGAVAALFRDSWLDPSRGQGGPRRLDALSEGDVLILERQSADGKSVDADPRMRWPVRLRSLERLVLPSATDPRGQPVISATWAGDDALPFDLPVWDVRDGRPARDLSVAQGNILAVDQGRTMHRTLPRPSEQGVYNPSLIAGSLIHAVPYAPDRFTAASAFVAPDVTQAVAAVGLIEQRTIAPARPEIAPVVAPPPTPGPPPPLLVETYDWTARADLLSSGPFAREFVVETDTDDVSLRFGDGVFGRRPDSHSAFTAVFRQGDMTVGAAAPEAIATLVAPDARTASRWLEQVVVVRNPLAATGATPPDPVNLARRLAAVGVKPESLASLADYETACLAFRDVDQAKAEVESQGAWPLIVVYVRRRRGRPIDAAFLQALAGTLEDRLIGGRRLDIRSARAIGVSITLEITFEQDRFIDRMRTDLQAAFSPVDGFFDLDRWPLGSTLYASALISAAMAVPGVVEASIARLERVDRPARTAAERRTPLAVFGAHEYPIVDAEAASPYGHIGFDLTKAR